MSRGTGEARQPTFPEPDELPRHNGATRPQVGKSRKTSGAEGIGGNGGAEAASPVVLAGCLCAGFPASTFNTCTTLLLQKYCSRFSPKEVG